MNVVIDPLFLRQPRFNYVSPAICEAQFSSTGATTVIIEPHRRLLAPTGNVVGGLGHSFVSYNIATPGVVCVSIWVASDPGNPDSPYNLVSECVPPGYFALCSPGWFQVSAITPNGETALSSPLEVTGDGYQFVPVPQYPDAICYNIYKAFNFGDPPVLYMSCVQAQTFEVCTPGCVRVSAITTEGETPLSEPLCPDAHCEVTPVPTCPPNEGWNTLLCSCRPCAEAQECPTGYTWSESACGCVSNGGGGGPHPMALDVLTPDTFCAGEAYTGLIQLDGGVGPFVWTLVSGVLPLGLTFHGGGTNDPFVVIDGTPSIVGDYTFTVRCTDIDGYIAEQTYTLRGMKITTASLPNGVKNTPYSQTLTEAGGNSPFVWSVVSGSLPPGLSLNPSTGEISGTPSVNGLFNFTIQLVAN